MKRFRYGTPYYSEDLAGQEAADDTADDPDAAGDPDADEAEDAQDWSVDGGPLSTLEAAVDACRDVILEQVERGARAVRNSSIEGDSRAKAMYLVLLTNEAQRDLFQSIMRDPRAWPRARALFGVRTLLAPRPRAGRRPQRCSRRRHRTIF